MERLYYWHYSEELGEVAIPKETAEEGLTIYAPELQGYTDEQLKEFADNNGDGFFDGIPYTREMGLEFAAWFIQWEILEGRAELSPMIHTESV